MTQDDWNKLKVGTLIVSGPECDQYMGVITHIEVSRLTFAVDWMSVQWNKYKGLDNHLVVHNFWDFVDQNVHIVQDPSQ